MYPVLHRSDLCQETEGLEYADSLVQKSLDIIDYFKPKAFIVEDPYTGMLKKRPLMLPMEQYLRRVTYCRYGLPYKKETAIWTNLGEYWQPRPLCTRANPCPQVIDFWHPASAQQRERLSQPRFKKEELYIIPADLCRELAAATEAFCSLVENFVEIRGNPVVTPATHGNEGPRANLAT